MGMWKKLKRVAAGKKSKKASTARATDRSDTAARAASGQLEVRQSSDSPARVKALEALSQSENCLDNATFEGESEGGADVELAFRDMSIASLREVLLDQSSKLRQQEQDVLELSRQLRSARDQGDKLHAEVQNSNFKLQAQAQTISGLEAKLQAKEEELVRHQELTLAEAGRLNHCEDRIRSLEEENKALKESVLEAELQMLDGALQSKCYVLGNEVLAGSRHGTPTRRSPPRGQPARSPERTTPRGLLVPSIEERYVSPPRKSHSQNRPPSNTRRRRRSPSPPKLARRAQQPDSPPRMPWRPVACPTPGALDRAIKGSAETASRPQTKGVPKKGKSRRSSVAAVHQAFPGRKFSVNFCVEEWKNNHCRDWGQAVWTELQNCTVGQGDGVLRTLAERSGCSDINDARWMLNTYVWHVKSSNPEATFDVHREMAKVARFCDATRRLMPEGSSHRSQAGKLR